MRSGGGAVPASILETAGFAKPFRSRTAPDLSRRLASKHSANPLEAWDYWSNLAKRLGLRQSSAAFEAPPVVRKRQMTAAVQDASRDSVSWFRRVCREFTLARWAFFRRKCMIRRHLMQCGSISPLSATLEVCPGDPGVSPASLRGVSHGDRSPWETHRGFTGHALVPHAKDERL
jgi:hypothetical protein